MKIRIAAMLLALPAVLHAQRLRMIIGTGAVCRAKPDAAAEVVQRYRLGDMIGADRASPDSVWLFDGHRVTGLRPECWVSHSLTTPLDPRDPVAALTALADRMLARDSVRFEEYVEAENLLIGRRYAPALASSGALQYRRLQLVAKAADAGQPIYGHPRLDPLATAWALAHQDWLWWNEFGALWQARGTPFWMLHDAHPDSAWADDLAWTAAQQTVPADECYSDCILAAFIIGGPQQYWTRRPSGTHIGAALRLARERVTYAAQVACEDPERPPREYRLIDSVRTSLVRVRSDAKGAVLVQLDSIEARCRRKVPG